MKPGKWAYILTGLIPPAKVVSPDAAPALADSIEEINFAKIEIRLIKVFLTERDRIRQAHTEPEHQARFVFYVKDGIKDDNLAQSVADAVMLALVLIYDLTMEAIPLAIRIPEAMIKKGKLIRIKDLVNSTSVGSELYLRIINSTVIPSVVMDEVWRAVPTIVESKSLLEAAYFYRESLEQARVTDNNIFDLMQDNTDVPASPTERADVETAYQNALKAIEAIIGEPPQDERELRMQLQKAGINPDEEIGYELYGMKPWQETILKKLVDMHPAGDKKPAPGKTGTPGSIGYRELKDKQTLARHLLLSHIFNALARN